MDVSDEEEVGGGGGVELRFVELEDEEEAGPSGDISLLVIRRCCGYRKVQLCVCGVIVFSAGNSAHPHPHPHLPRPQPDHVTDVFLSQLSYWHSSSSVGGASAPSCGRTESCRRAGPTHLQTEGRGFTWES